MSTFTDTTEQTTKPLPTIWNVPDALWNVLHPLLEEYDPPKKRGRKRIDARRALGGIIFRMRTGCHWNHLPQEFGDDSSIHRTLQRWESISLFDILWATWLTHCQELGGVDWHWQAVDCRMGKARGVPKEAQENHHPHSAKRGRRKSALVPIPPIVVSRASRRVCIPKRTEGR
jgi:transposase